MSGTSPCTVVRMQVLVSESTTGRSVKVPVTFRVEGRAHVTPEGAQLALWRLMERDPELRATIAAEARRRLSELAQARGGDA